MRSFVGWGAVHSTMGRDWTAAKGIYGRAGYEYAGVWRMR